ncbi:hypothetical protein OKA06_01375 [Novosphingobium sp. MW5]|nr:hypothetical protein [Novosphingobium sp. MW5]
MLGIITIGKADLVSAQTPAVAAAPAPGATGLRRLNEAQYARSIAQVFGPGITIPGRFEPSLRDKGLLAIGDSAVTVTGSGIEQYELRAREISAQVIREKRVQVPCTPFTGSFDETCARSVVAAVGRQLYRRPLVDSELASIIATGARRDCQQPLVRPGPAGSH